MPGSYWWTVGTGEVGVSIIYGAGDPDDGSTGLVAERMTGSVRKRNTYSVSERKTGEVDDE